MLSIANNPSTAINYMEHKKDFFIVKDESASYDFYAKIAHALQPYDKNGQPVDYIEKSTNVTLDLNRLLAQLGTVLSLGAGDVLKLINHHKDKQLDKIVELSKMYKITLQYDKRILFEFIEK
ncbi:hypothetical protein [Lactiplantibacillus plantarum]|uniref:hypothetical protein n=1 Tax=Lactiplantibacillus plantarum TaxID=1590 RepID=UPI0009322DE7|nr:hypothetical protein [Lactiplantibacillus plantarum]